MDYFLDLGMLASFILPIFNIPLIMKMVKRQSSSDISMTWAAGVWICILLMTPRAVTSPDVVFRIFGVTNLVFFSAVFFCTVKYRKGNKLSY